MALLSTPAILRQTYGWRGRGPFLFAVCACFSIVDKHVVCCAGPVKETLQPYVAFHAALRSAHMAFVTRLESQARTLLRHHLDTATSEFALSLLMSSVSLEPAAPAYQQPAAMLPPGGRRAAAAAAADDGENMPPQDDASDEGQVGWWALASGNRYMCGLMVMLWYVMIAAHAVEAPDCRQHGHDTLCLSVPLRCLQLSVSHRTPYRPIQMTVPETPSPEILMQQQSAVVGTTNRRAGPGRHVSDTTPSKGRVAKAQRVDDGSMGGEWAGQALQSCMLTVEYARPSFMQRQAVGARPPQRWQEPCQCGMLVALLHEACRGQALPKVRKL